MAISRPTEVFELPTLAKPSRDSIKTRPKAVDRWIADLPKADANQYARRIYEILREVNGLNIAEKDRAYICHALFTPVAEATNYFKRHFITDALPLSAKNRVLAEAAVSLNLEMAISHKILLSGSMDTRITMLNRSSICEKLGLTAYYLVRVLLLCFQNYVDHPAQTWRHLHNLYAWAEQNDLLQREFRIETENHQSFTVEQLYKQILLVALLPPYRLRQRMIEKLFHQARDWTHYCKILGAEEFKQGQDHVLVRLNSDSTPGYYLSEKTYQRDHTRVLDLAPLVHLLREQIMHQVVAENDIKFVDIPDEVMQLLLATWGGESVRQSERNDCSKEFNVSIGIAASFDLIKTLRREKEEGQPPDPQKPQASHLELADTVTFAPKSDNDDSKPVISLALEEDDPDNRNLNLKVYKQDNADPWSAVPDNSSINYDHNIKEWMDKKKNPSSSAPYAFENTNESTDGYCLSTHIRYGQQSGKMQIGEITGLHQTQSSGAAAVAVGVIRRIKHQNSVLELGIQKLAAYSSAVEIAQYHPQAISRKYFPSLMLPSIKSEKLPVTLLTQQKFKAGDQLVIRKNQNLTLINLIDCIANTGVASQFTFQVVKDLGKDEEPSSSSGNFDAAWSLI